MKKSAICITLATLALAGCNNDEKNAQARLDNAEACMNRMSSLLPKMK
ncbi:lipoprotein [Parabacteroides merdae]|nr:lipoprotein [Parabacteroides merdae]